VGGQISGSSGLAGAAVLVAGATGGLGRAVCAALAARGALLVLSGRDAAALAALAAELAIESAGRASSAADQDGEGVPTVAADLRKASAAERVVAGAVAARGGLDGVVFAAGVVAFGAATDLPDQVMIDLFGLNTLAPIRLLRAATPHLQAARDAGGAPFVVNLSAVVAETPLPGMAAYAASKAALTAFDRAATRELRRIGVRVIDARPPHTETGLAGRPVFGAAPRLPRGLAPEAVAARIVRAIEDGETDLPSTAFG